MSSIRAYLPHIILSVSIIAIMVGAYAAIGFGTSTPKALWSTNPITITGTGTASDAFKCAPPVSGTIVLTVSDPALLTISPSTFSGCGPSFDTITLTAHSATSATVTVTVQRVNQYGNTILPPLTVNIVVH